MKIKEYYKAFFSKSSTVTNYGVKVNIGQNLLYTFIVIGLVLGVGYVCDLDYICLSIIGVFSLFMVPIIVIAGLNQKVEAKKFEMVSSYLTNIIPLFIQKPKILNSLKEVNQLVDSRMKVKTQEAIDYIETNYEDPEPEKTALGFIEDEFKNTRIRAVHKTMLSIEAGNSKRHQETCMMLFEDVDAWIGRVNIFQQELKNKRMQMILLICLTVFMNTLMTYMYKSNETFAGYSDYKIYQISTSVFLIALLLTFTVTISKLHGAWIVNDYSKEEVNEMEKEYNKFINKETKISTVDFIVPIIFITLGLSVYFIFRNIIITVAIILASILMLIRALTRNGSARKKLSEYLKEEFPLWLRDISLNLNYLTVTNAISKSKEIASYPMEKEIEKFEQEHYINPASILPFTNFMADYDVPDALSSMKVLYSIQNLGTKEMETQITNLINRNQKLLEKSEQIKNQNQLAATNLLGFVPMGLFTVQLLINIVIVIMIMMNYLSGTVAF